MKLNRRGRIVRALLIAFGISLALWGLLEISRSLWWVGTDAPTAQFAGYCWGQMAECFNF
jgi:hypothetical protein